MARIRTIKPEFPLSESIGRLSRDARLLFIQLWTICDDEGRTRAASRVLASLLYPFDEDSHKLIGGWLGQLEKEGLIVRYEVDGSSYLEVTTWKKHQKIDRPTPSRLPNPPVSTKAREDSRAFDALPSTLDLVPRTVDLGSVEVREQVRDLPSEDLKPTDPEAPGWPKKADLQIAVNYWNEVAGEVGLPRISGLAGERAKHLAARLKDIGSLGEWFAAVGSIKDQPFLVGKNDRNWRANFDWFVKPGNFSKVVENTYERSRHNGRA